MKKLLWLGFGICMGFVAAHFVNRDPRGRELLAEVDARISGFTEAMTEAYHAQEARFTDESSR